MMHTTHKDPVCGMEVSTDTTFSIQKGDEIYYFCSQSCQEKFEKNPEAYIGVSAEEDCPSCKPIYTSEPQSTEMIYTCPMHPEIRQIGPGTCPKCGMALEPVAPAAGQEENAELDDMTRRFVISTILAIPVFLLAMIADLAPQWLPQWLSMKAVQWIEFVLATPVVLWGGWPFFVRGYQSVKSWNLNMFTLIALGVGAAWLYSMAALLFPQIFPPKMQMDGGIVHVYFEAAAVIVALVLLGQVLELRARSQTNTAIQKLLSLAPKRAVRVKEDGSEEEIALEDVKVGDILRIRPGEKIPVDGVVIEGGEPYRRVDGDRGAYRSLQEGG